MRKVDGNKTIAILLNYSQISTKTRGERKTIAGVVFHTYSQYQTLFKIVSIERASIEYQQTNILFMLRICTICVLFRLVDEFCSQLQSIHIRGMRHKHQLTMKKTQLNLILICIKAYESNEFMNISTCMMEKYFCRKIHLFELVIVDCTAYR